MMFQSVIKKQQLFFFRNVGAQHTLGREDLAKGDRLKIILLRVSFYRSSDTLGQIRQMTALPKSFMLHP